jgi:hypothetical protein
MPCTPFCSPSALFCQVEELRDVLHIMCCQLFEHLLVSHAYQKVTTTVVLEMQGWYFKPGRTAG